MKEGIEIEKFINEIVDIPKLIRRLWLVLWFVEFICIGSKLLFHTWFPIVIENQNFENVCDFVDNHQVLRVSIMAIFYVASLNIVFLIATKSKFYKDCTLPIISNLLIVFSFIIGNINSMYGKIAELFTLIVLPIICNIKRQTFKELWKNICFPVFTYLLISLWQLNMLFVRGIDDISNLHFAVGMVLQIDYYIFIIITWLGVNWSMGLWGAGLFWSNKITQLEAKKKKLENKIKYIDNKIEQLKAKSIEKSTKEQINK